MPAITLELFTSQIPDDQERWLHRWMESHEYLHRHQRCHEWQLETEHWQCRRHRDLELLAAQLVYLRQVRRLQRLKWWFRQPSRSLLYRLQVYWAVSLFSLYITHTHTHTGIDMSPKLGDVQYKRGPNSRRVLGGLGQLPVLTGVTGSLQVSRVMLCITGSCYIYISKL